MVAGRRGTATHIDAKIAAQLVPRGWTEQELREAVDAAPIGTAVDYTSGAPQPATVYGARVGGYLIVNDATWRVVPISDKTDPNWIPDDRIEWA